jgi:hypothetical protein
MNKTDLIELIILNRAFCSIGFSKSSLNTYTQNEVLKNEVFNEIEKIKFSTELVCDRLRTMGNTTREHFVKLLSKDYEFTNDLIYRELYNYGMFATR